MASIRRNKVVASRRRRDDDGEEEGSVTADIEDDSLSEGSVISNGDDDADIEPSDISEDDSTKIHPHNSAPVQLDSRPFTERSAVEPNKESMSLSFIASSDTTAMMNGLKLTEGQDVPEVQFDQTAITSADPVVDVLPSPGKPLTETRAERGRREHLEYLKQKKENPAFVPTRGGFFLHDDRAAPLGPNGVKGPIKGRGRGGPAAFPISRLPPFAEPTSQPWAHDLHDSGSTEEPTKPEPSRTVPHGASEGVVTVPTLSSVSKEAPNRTFSTTILLGKVPVIINLPGTQAKVTVPNVAKKKHTLLPHHRPPLRRDKPVRVSIPNQPPRYIFPSTERSFIFIPRALRPNQQGFGRGRGRNSFNPSRRTSVYGGSNYTPSVAMSRRSSLGGIMAGETVRSPGGSVMSLPVGYIAEPGKPVVRFPPLSRPVPMVPSSSTQQVNGGPSGTVPLQPSLPNHDRYESIPDALTMHQPRPQKAVSVADIESPAKFSFNPPPQQQEVPFHQQVPLPVNPQIYSDEGVVYNAHVRRLSHASRPSGTPLSQIPERAIYAQPFQPLPLPPQVPGYLPPAYVAGEVFYPTMQGELAPYGSALATAGMPLGFAPGNHPPPYILPAAPVTVAGPPAENGSTSTVAHESNGMVYYYDSSQFPTSSVAPYSATFAGAPVGGVVGMGGMMTPPNHVFYPSPNHGVYYTAQ